MRPQRASVLLAAAVLTTVVLAGLRTVASPQDDIDRKIDEAEEAIEQMLREEGADESEMGKALADFFRGTIEAVRSLKEDVEEADRTIGVSRPSSDGLKLFRAGKHEQAETAFARAAQDPKDVYARYLLGCTLFELGRYDEAHDCFARLFSEDERFRSARLMGRTAELCAADSREGKECGPAGRF